MPQVRNSAGLVSVVYGANAIEALLFDDQKANAYAILDGARIPGLLNKLDGLVPESLCLYRGSMTQDLAEVAPYLIRLRANEPFTNWTLKEGFEKKWGIFLKSEAGTHELHRHFRKFLIVKLPDGKDVYFRYYDPRVLRVYLPTCTSQELKDIFGPVNQFLCEGENAASALIYQIERS